MKKNVFPAIDLIDGKCVRLYQDESLWRSVQDAGLEAITKDCSPEQFQQELESLFD